jgi:hypothetical protein
VTTPFEVAVGSSLIVPANGQFVFQRGLVLTGTLEIVVNDAVGVPVPVVVTGLLNMQGAALVMRTASGAQKHVHVKEQK